MGLRVSALLATSLLVAAPRAATAADAVSPADAPEEPVPVAMSDEDRAIVEDLDFWMEIGAAEAMEMMEILTLLESEEED